MKKLIMVALLAGLLGTVAVLAQNEPPPPQRDRPMPPQFSQQAQQQHQMMMQQFELQRQQQMLASQPKCPLCRHGRHMLGVIVLVSLVIHILLATWVYQDIRRRGTGSGIWIVVTLLAGLFGAAVYALVRLGEKPGTPST